MRHYFLIDGMMIYQTMRTEQLLQDAQAIWWMPLLEGHRLVGPMLIDAALAEAAGEPVVLTVGRLMTAFPSRLHLSTIHSQADLSALAQHLRRFAAFYDEDAQLVAFRFADNRRLIDLPSILTDEQWGYLTSLMTRWTCHNRQGKELTLDLPQQRSSLQSDQPFRLGAEQIQALEIAAQPDALLHRLGYTPQMMSTDMSAYWQLAQQCVALWKNSGNGNHDVLFYFSRRIFSTHGRALKERDWQTFLVRATPADVVKLED